MTIWSQWGCLALVRSFITILTADKKITNFCYLSHAETFLQSNNLKSTIYFQENVRTINPPLICRDQAMCSWYIVSLPCQEEISLPPETYLPAFSLWKSVENEWYCRNALVTYLYGCRFDLSRFRIYSLN